MATISLEGQRIPADCLIALGQLIESESMNARTFGGERTHISSERCVSLGATRDSTGFTGRFRLKAGLPAVDSSSTDRQGLGPHGTMRDSPWFSDQPGRSTAARTGVAPGRCSSSSGACRSQAPRGVLDGLTITDTRSRVSSRPISSVRLMFDNGSDPANRPTALCQKSIWIVSRFHRVFQRCPSESTRTR